MKKLLFVKISVYAFLLGHFHAMPVFGFGQNKVQYTVFSWRSLQASRFTLYFHQNQGSLPQVSYRLTEAIYRTLSRRFQFTHKDPVPVIVYGDPNLFGQTNVITELLPEEVGGFTELFKNRVAVPFSGSLDEFNHVVHHEMVHAFIYGIFYDKFGSELLSGGGMQIPLWFNEGLAEYLSSGWNVESDMFLMDYTINAEVPPPGPALDGYMAYKGGQSFLFFLAASRGDSLFLRFLREFKSSRSLVNSIKRVFKKSLEELGKEWIQELKRNYWPELGRRVDPSRSATPVTQHVTTRDNFNLRPRISPDGKRIAFFSDRYDFTKILITDRTGRVLQTISQTGYGGYFESFHPFRSGMCWSPDGEKLAFVTKNGPCDQIRVVDVKKHRLVKTISTPCAGVAGPDWSRDGSMIAFTGIDSGWCDLFVYDLERNDLRRLTRDGAFESDPHFSPDGFSIIYAVQDTCMNVEDPPVRAWGFTQNHLALIDRRTGAVRVLSRKPWNEKQPCFSPKGDSVLFVSDRNGIDNVYIAPFDSLDKAKPITDFIGGCSNPDWSRDGGAVVYTLFQKLGWDVWLMEKPQSRVVADSLEKTRWIEARLDTAHRYFIRTPVPPDTGKPAGKQQAEKNRQEKTARAKDSSQKIQSPDTVPAPKDSSVKTALPAAGQKGDSAAAAKARPPVGPGKALTDSIIETAAALPAAPESTTVRQQGFIPQSEPYRLRFSPDLVTVGLGVSSFYGYAGQWLLSLSDIMGDHRITLAGDVQNDFQSTLHFFGAYEYYKRRISIGGGAFYFKNYIGYSDALYYYAAEFGGFFRASYPFSRFSRSDFQLLAQKVDANPQGTDSVAVAKSGGRYSFATLLPSLSYSYDNILWGLTGPMTGLRAQGTIEALPPLSSLKDPFVSCEIDVRHYWHLVRRFVWANRMYIGASQPLSGGESPRRYLLGGSENWIFGAEDINYSRYDRDIRNSFYSDVVVPFRGWRYFDLSGTRVAVFNTEFRFPFVKEFTTVFPFPLSIRYVNGAVFADLGNAWDRHNEVSGLPVPKNVYGGAGFGCRINLAMFVLRYDRSWPFSFYVVEPGEPEPGGPINYFSLGAEF